MKENFRKYMLAFCILVAIGAGFYMLVTYMQRQAVRQSYEALAQESRIDVEEVVLEPEVVEEPEVEEPEEEPEPEIPLVPIPIDFRSLQAMNPDIHGWISIPGTIVEYPILQSQPEEWQEFYLHHTAERVPSDVGSIFTQDDNQRDFSDVVTLIYGHNMLDGSMFSELHRYLDNDFLNAHPDVTIYTPDAILTYRIFGVITFDNRHLMDAFDFTTDEGYQEFIDTIYGFRSFNRNWDYDVDITPGDRLIVMSTCVGMQSQRLLVTAVLIDEQPGRQPD